MELEKERMQHSLELKKMELELERLRLSPLRKQQRSSAVPAATAEQQGKPVFGPMPCTFPAVPGFPAEQMDFQDPSGTGVIIHESEEEQPDDPMKKVS